MGCFERGAKQPSSDLLVCIRLLPSLSADACALLMTSSHFEDHIAHFVLNGGFMYFDVNSKVCGLSCVRGIRAELAVKRGVHNIIQFGPGVTLYDASYVSVKQSLGNRLHGVSLAMMRKKNASKYGWVRPLETFGGLLANNPYGGFIYEFEPVAESDGHCRFFPVLGVDD